MFLHQGLDYVIVEARKNGIRLIFSLVNNLNAFGGKAQYVKWAQDAGINISSSTDSFFADSTIKGYYKAYIKVLDYVLAGEEPLHDASFVSRCKQFYSFKMSVSELSIAFQLVVS